MSGRNNIGDCFTNHFGDLFCSSNLSIPFDLANLITKVLSPTNVTLLDIIPTSEEIFQTVKSLRSTKAPGPNGLPTLFYTAYWDIVGNEVISTVQEFFNTGRLMKSLNHTFIVLIPKVGNPFKVSHYRPISLCNVSYKIIAKIIATTFEAISTMHDF